MSSHLSEFQLIEQFFAPLSCRKRGGLAIGDDAALWPEQAGRQTVLCTDTLVEGRHFFPDIHPAHLAWKAVAVNVSDLLAMGAEPAAYLLALTLPKAEPDWLSAFAEGLKQAQAAFGVCLLGGDTTAGEQLTVTVSAVGHCPLGQAWRRSGAQPGDHVWLSGRVGDAALGLARLSGKASSEFVPDSLVDAQLRPEPPVELARWLRTQGRVHAAIDISDGLVQDAGHVARQSGVDMRLFLADMPLSSPVRTWCENQQDWQLPLAGGEDYQLLWTAPADWTPHQAPVPIFRIGEVVSGTGQVHVLDEQGRPVSLAQLGFQHF